MGFGPERNRSHVMIKANTLGQVFRTLWPTSLCSKNGAYMLKTCRCWSKTQSSCLRPNHAQHFLSQGSYSQTSAITATRNRWTTWGLQMFAAKPPAMLGWKLCLAFSVCPNGGLTCRTAVRRTSVGANRLLPPERNGERVDWNKWLRTGGW